MCYLFSEEAQRKHRLCTALRENRTGRDGSYKIQGVYLFILNNHMVLLFQPKNVFSYRVLDLWAMPLKTDLVIRKNVDLLFLLAEVQPFFAKHFFDRAS